MSTAKSISLALRNPFTGYRYVSCCRTTIRFPPPSYMQTVSIGSQSVKASIEKYVYIEETHGHADETNTFLSSQVIQCSAMLLQ